MRRIALLGCMHPGLCAGELNDIGYLIGIISDSLQEYWMTLH